MVRVIDPGPDVSVVKEVVCRGCGATMEYVPNDIQSQTYREIDGGSDTRHYITCPQCNKEISVEHVY